MGYIASVRDLNAVYPAGVDVARRARGGTRDTPTGLHMYFVLLGLLLLTLKLAGIGPVAQWAWWWVLSPFLAAVLWWAWADATGYYKRREMRKMDEKRAKRRERDMDALGTNPKRRVR